MYTMCLSPLVLSMMKLATNSYEARGCAPHRNRSLHGLNVETRVMRQIAFAMLFVLRYKKKLMIKLTLMIKTMK